MGDNEQMQNNIKAILLEKKAQIQQHTTTTQITTSIVK